jgi:hypothetical protein
MSHPNYDELVRSVREMRRLQRGFFSSKPGTQERSAYLRESRRLERQVDDMLAEMDHPQAQGVLL